MVYREKETTGMGSEGGWGKDGRAIEVGDDSRMGRGRRSGRLSKGIWSGGMGDCGSVEWDAMPSITTEQSDHGSSAQA